MVQARLTAPLWRRMELYPQIPARTSLLQAFLELQHSLSPQEDRRNWNLQHPAVPAAWIHPFQVHKKGTHHPDIQTMVLRHLKFK